eukprot:CAMPEP_0167813350 /NCGR_PEP_ID=MMETSP0112_2-20121227/1800_1 /TAXON_ID=91324 /ORGANISM="Lotharella globosa, Strain CCCM811" /LENGTH=343 /DNA_ID=CAMNT_0007712413 /DNA_START=78 /DNA_END=1106 /DNA_ORIENTATION=-
MTPTRRKGVFTSSDTDLRMNLRRNGSAPSLGSPGRKAINIQVQKFMRRESHNITDLTDLHRAAARGHVRKVKRLLAANAEVCCETRGGWTPLHFACKAGSVEVAKMLLDAKANASLPSLSQHTPLHEAASVGNAQLTELLLHHNADVVAEDVEGMLPINQAAASWILRKSQYHFTEFNDFAGVMDVLTGYETAKCSNMEKRVQLVALILQNQMDAAHHVLSRQLTEFHGPTKSSYRYDFEILLPNTPREEDEFMEMYRARMQSIVKWRRRGSTMASGRSPNMSETTNMSYVPTSHKTRKNSTPQKKHSVFGPLDVDSLKSSKNPESPSDHKQKPNPGTTGPAE